MRSKPGFPAPRGGGLNRQKSLASGAALALAVGGCNPMRFDTTVKPIEISLYVKIDQDVRVRIDKDLEDLIASSAGLVSFHKVIDASEPRIPGGLPSPGAGE